MIKKTIFSLFFVHVSLYGVQTINKEDKVFILSRTQHIKDALYYQSWFGSRAFGIISNAAPFVGEKVPTQIELDMLPLFEIISAASETQIHSWLERFDASNLEFKSILEKQYKKNDLQQCLHKHTVQRFFPGQTLSITELNDKVKSIPSEQKKDLFDEAMFRLTVDFFHDKNSKFGTKA